MLGGQNGGGNQHGHLLSFHDGLERGAQCHFRLAEAYVATEKPVHGKGGFHVGLDLGDGSLLVGGLLVGKGIFELPLPWGVGAEGVAARGLPGGVEM